MILKLLLVKENNNRLCLLWKNFGSIFRSNWFDFNRIIVFIRQNDISFKIYNIIWFWLLFILNGSFYISWYLCAVTCSYFIFLGFATNRDQLYEKSYDLLGRFVRNASTHGGYWKQDSFPGYISNGWWRRDFTVWIVFNFPPARIIDFLIGCDLGYLFLCRKENKVTSRSRQFTIAEFIVGG